jgi:hypothetical protein
MSAGVKVAETSRDLSAVTSVILAETDAEVVLLIEKIGATSIGEIEKLIGGMQEAKNFLVEVRAGHQCPDARMLGLTVPPRIGARARQSPQYPSSRFLVARYIRA